MQTRKKEIKETVIVSMSKNHPTSKPLLADDIIECLGEAKGFADSAKQSYAKGLIEEVERLCAASGTAFPNRSDNQKLDDDLTELLEHISQAKRIAKRIEKKAEKEPHVQSLLSISARAVAKLGYRSDVSDVMAMLTVAAKATKNVRFQNTKKGPDTRLAEEIALVTARRYKKSFGEMPGIAGGGDRVDGNITPYQRVCAYIARTKGIAGIGKATQKAALELLASKALSPWPFFKPDTSWLPPKAVSENDPD